MNRKRGKKWLTKERLINLYYTQCKTIREVSNVAHCGDDTVKKLLDEYGLEIRETGRPSTDIAKKRFHIRD